MKRLFFLSLFTALVLATSAQEYRDVVYLKNGSVIKGFYKSFVMNDTLRMNTLDGSTLVCPTSDILRIAKEKTDVYVIKEDDFSDINPNWRPRGYSGSFELFYGICTADETLKSDAIYTTQGYRFNRHIFLGVGVGLERYSLELSGITIQQKHYSIPLYGEARWYVLNKRITPYLSCRAGYTAYGLKGAFVCPAIGADFAISPHVGAYVKLMYRWQKYTYDWETGNIATYIYDWNSVDWNDDTAVINAKGASTSFLIISTGFRF